MGAADPVTSPALKLWRTFGGCEAALLGLATPPLDDWPFGGHEAAPLGWATLPPAVYMVRADRDEKMKARCHMPKLHPAGCFLTRVHPGIGLPGCRRQYRHQAEPLVTSGRDARMMRLVTGWTSIQGKSCLGCLDGLAY